ncbi:uncharacterized protein FIBRA_09456 [Fibroporia radiculosa]|uniref:Uncharacterized protein n=1 Tax=Fibroporia radiculosa TaxID=599839 RepID=J7RHQ2_9APHY|nr:uncharacterized protein FIBRA_09456 [Fibroporia radiculosa]CCM07122.1 predicted protein [Fibroporia radiculosa]
MASTTILVALLLCSWFLTALLILVLSLTLFFFKETYTVRFHIEHTPTPITAPITKQALNWVNNRTQVTSPIELTPTLFTDLLSGEPNHPTQHCNPCHRQQAPPHSPPCPSGLIPHHPPCYSVREGVPFFS